jgi:hypothetical protein
MNLQAGIVVAATRGVSFELGGDHHPGTDTISDNARVNSSLSYWALRIGASLRM